MEDKSRKTKKASKGSKVKKPSPAQAGTKTTAGSIPRVLNARPDGIDFRDQMYVPTLVEVPMRRDLADYLVAKAPVLDQGHEGACTGYGLAAVAHYLLRVRKIDPDPGQVSPQMLYAIARRYDEWAGEDYEGSSCRGAMKGWYKHGVCAADIWTSNASVPQVLSHEMVADAVRRPLGAYFRVNHKSLVAMHAAITEVGILYASANVHTGWQKVRQDGLIPLEEGLLGGHAFAIVAYDQDGFWIQNSWGENWGFGGFAHISYEDWLANGSDVWVARLGVPVRLPETTQSTDPSSAGAVRSKAYQYSDIRAHVISLKNDGQLDDRGNIGTSADMVREILRNDFPRITKGWKKKRLVLYAHGGLVNEDSAIQRVSDYRNAMLKTECYPLAFIWKTDYWSTLKNMLQDAARRRRPEGIIDDTKDFMLDRLDDALEPIARILTGKAEWDEMKENALRATTTTDGGARLVADEIALLAKQFPAMEIHVVGHSAGSIFHAPLVQYLSATGPIKTGPLAPAKISGLGLKIKTCTLWAPACTTKLFKATYLPAISSGEIDAFTLFTLTDKAEQDDNCGKIYNKSLLYLVSNAFEDEPRIPIFRPGGDAILGMEKFIRADSELLELFDTAGGLNTTWLLSPNTMEIGSTDASRSAHHGDFDDDEATVKATLARILGKDALMAEVKFQRTTSSRISLRQSISGR
ncbi:MAG: C1 family peptidase [Pseudomonadota bacterium]